MDDWIIPQIKGFWLLYFADMVILTPFSGTPLMAPPLLAPPELFL
jgi:hypothetical protein